MEAPFEKMICRMFRAAETVVTMAGEGFANVRRFVSLVGRHPAMSAIIGPVKKAVHILKTPRAPSEGPRSGYDEPSLVYS